jgi:hypothetical protein
MPLINNENFLASINENAFCGSCSNKILDSLIGFFFKALRNHNNPTLKLG